MYRGLPEKPGSTGLDVMIVKMDLEPGQTRYTGTLNKKNGGTTNSGEIGKYLDIVVDSQVTLEKLPVELPKI